MQNAPAFYDVGKNPYQYYDTNSGSLGAGADEWARTRTFSNPFGALYGPGQVGLAHYQPGLPYAGLNKRDFVNLSPVSTISHDPTINALQGNGAYFHGVITLQDLINVQAQTSSGAPG